MKKVGSIESIIVAIFEVQEDKKQKEQIKKLWKNYQMLKSTKNLCWFNPN